MLDKNSGIKQTIVHLENPSIDAFCKEQTEALMRRTHSYTSVSKKLKSDNLYENYTIQTKTGFQNKIKILFNYNTFFLL